jgi:hypothetical protein
MCALFSQGLATNEHNPPLLSLLPICTLIDTIEFMPSNARAGTELVLPLLLANLYGIGVCAMHGGAAFDKSCGFAIKALLGAAGADPETAQALALPEDEVDMDIVRDNAVSSLFKIAVFQGEILGLVREQMLLFSLNNLPLRSDTSEARELHRLFVDLVASKDSRLLGPSGRMEFFPNVLRVLAELSATASGAEQHYNNTSSSSHDDDEYWESQIVSETTLNKLKVVLRAGLGPQSGIPSAIVQSAMSSMSKAARAEITKYIS